MQQSQGFTVGVIKRLIIVSVCSSVYASKQKRKYLNYVLDHRRIEHARSARLIIMRVLKGFCGQCQLTGP